MISVISFLNVDKMKSDQSVLKNVIDDMVSSNPGNKLEKIQYGTYEDHKDADFLITNKSYAISGRAFVDGNQLYVLSSLSKTPEESKSEFDYFLRSFKLTNNIPSNTVPFPIEK